MEYLHYMQDFIMQLSEAFMHSLSSLYTVVVWFSAQARHGVQQRLAACPYSVRCMQILHGFVSTFPHSADKLADTVEALAE